MIRILEYKEFKFYRLNIVCNGKLNKKKEKYLLYKIIILVFMF